MKKIILILIFGIQFAVAQNGLNVKDKAPNFSAKDQNGKTIVLSDVLKKGKVIIVFYRGNWCPNCMREMKSLQDSIGLLKEKNVTLLAITPESNDGVAKTIKITKASFSIISDEGLKILQSFKVAFPVTKEMDALHKKYNIDVVSNNGKNGNILPRPAAFIIGQDGIISYRFFNNNPYSNPKSNDRVTVKSLLANL
jgi:peroxiredoxin